MSTSLNAVFIVVSGNVFFVIVLSDIHGRKMRFSESSQNSMFEKSIFGHFEVIFLNLPFFSQGGSSYFLLARSKRKISTKR